MMKGGNLMDDKLKTWEERISNPPADTPEFEEYLELLIESRIVEER